MNSNVMQQDRGPTDKVKIQLTKEDDDEDDDQTTYLFIRNRNIIYFMIMRS